MANDAMRDYWDGVAGERWLNERELLDATLAPFLVALLDAVRARPGESILDVGCGLGTTTIELARQVAPGGRVVGADLSARFMAALAERVAADVVPGVEPLVADAQVDPLPGPFDAVVSRFGVMFFDDQDAAWRNIRAACRSGARLAFVCWQDAERNPWSRVPALAALAVSPSAEPAPGPEQPGPHALADPVRTRSILERAGWSTVVCTPFDTEVLLGRDLAEALRNVRGQAAVRGAIERAGAGAVLDAVTAALGPYAAGDGAIRLAGAAWVVTARA